jgi:alkaline phosphatase D
MAAGRNVQPCGGAVPSNCAKRIDLSRSIMGAGRERWLLNGFQQSQARWDFLGQQVFFSQLDFTPGPGHSFNPDAWTVMSRTGAVSSMGLVRSPVRNPVVLIGDVHSHWARNTADLRRARCSRRDAGVGAPRGALVAGSGPRRGLEL